MDLSPFTVYYTYEGMLNSAEIRPCCKEDRSLHYAVWEEGELAFTISRQLSTGIWIVTPKNAGDIIDDDLVQLIGAQIQKRPHQKKG